MFARFFGNVIGDNDVFNPQFRAHPANVAPTKVGLHAPVIGIGNRFHLERVDDHVQPIAAVARIGKRHDASGPVFASVRFDQLEQFFLRFRRFPGLVVVAVVAQSLVIELNERHGFLQNAARTAVQFRLRMD